MSGVKEECGVFGIYDLDGGNIAPSIYYGLTSLQHRGQESCGMAVSRTDGERGNVQFHKDLGLVSEVLRKDVVHNMNGDIGIGHVRYSTTGESVAENAQPLVLSYIKGSLALAHNGNLVNTEALKWELIQTGAIFHTTTDSEVIAFHIARERVHSATVEEAVHKTVEKIRGGYALVIMSPRRYWNSIHGCEKGEAEMDEEGKQTMRMLAKNMTFLMKSIELGKKEYGLPEQEERAATNFIR